MEYTIIEYNFNKYIRRIIFMLIYLNLIIIGVCIKIYHIDYSLLKLSLICLLGFWSIHALFVRIYNVLGVIIFNSDRILITRNDKEIVFVFSELINITFKYGGYKGEMREYEIFYTGSSGRDGTKNFININDNHFQFLVKSKSDADFIKNYLKDIKNYNINVKFIKK
jgi:hypothetical protein